MRVILNLDENVLDRLKEQADTERRSRKNYMEGVLASAANCIAPMGNSVSTYTSPTQKTTKPVIIITYEQFLKMVTSGGCDDPEDHRIFIETVNKAPNLSPKQKETLIVASRTKQN